MLGCGEGTYVDAGALGQVLELGLHAVALQAGHATVIDQANSAAFGHIWRFVLARHRRDEAGGHGDRSGMNRRVLGRSNDDPKYVRRVTAVGSRASPSITFQSSVSARDQSPECSVAEQDARSWRR